MSEVGSIWPPVREDPPARESNAGRKSKVSEIRAFLEEQGAGAEDAYRIGTYKTAQAPRKAFLQHGLKVWHVKLDGDLYARYVSLASEGASVTPLRSADG